MRDIISLTIALTIAHNTVGSMNTALSSAAHGGGILGIYATVAQSVLSR